MKRLQRFCEERSLPLTSEALERFIAYRDLLLRFNEAMNLIGPLSADEVEVELLLDSLVPAAARQPRGPILDVGTGAGLPGIPLKLLYPDLPITLVEPRQKRSTFLKICAHRLELQDTTITRARIEDLPPEPFDFVISKAFQPPLNWLHTASAWIADDGAVLVMARQADQPALLEKASTLDLHLLATASPDTSSTPDTRTTFAFTPAPRGR